MPPGLRASHATLDTLPKLQALAATLLSTLDALAEGAMEEDDRPRIFANTLLRWARDEEAPAALASAARALDADAWRTRSPAELATPWGRASHAANALASWRAQCMRYPTHTRQAVPRCTAVLVSVWVALGEPEEAARVRVGALYASHFRALTGREPDVSPTDPAAWEGVERFANMRRFSE